MLSLADIELLFARHGAAQYSGEPVTQLEHALQTAHFAEQSDASDELVTACLLHDLGHLLNEQGETPTLRGIDDTHQYFALPFLRGLFADRGARCDQAARRCQALPLPGRRAATTRRLSDDSKRSLALQGGVFDAAGAAALPRPARRRTTRCMLRQWDDLAKQAELATPSLAHFLDRAARCALRRARDDAALSWPIVAAVLFGALLHASWNALIKSGDDKALDTALIHLLGCGLGAALVLTRVGLPRRRGAAVGLRLGRHPRRLLRHAGRRLPARRARLRLPAHARHRAAAGRRC